MGTSQSPSNLRYTQLLGWKSERSPIRFTIGRQGKWFRWMIAETANNGNNQPFFNAVDSGEAPEPPSRLRRFWREIAANEPRTTSLDRTDAVAEKDKNLETPLKSASSSNEPAAPPATPVENPERLETAPEATDQQPDPIINDPNESQTPQ